MATYRTTIKFNYGANGGSNAPAATTNTYSTGAMGRTTVSYAITSAKPTPPTGKHFVNWLVRYDGDTYSDISSSPANYGYISSGGTQSVTYPASNYNNRTINFIYYAAYALNTYTVSYNANGGSGAPGAQTKTYGQTLKLSTTKPTRTGYTFQGWATSSGGAVAYAAGANYTANAGVTLYAVWKLNTYAITYNANGGTGAPANGTKNYGQAYTISSTKPTRSGYTFNNWKGSNNITYAAGGTIAANVNQAVTLTAQWTLITYTISYNANGGSGAPSNQTKNYGQTLVLSSTVPTRKGYKFLGWSTSSTATSATYSAGGNYTANAAAVLYAVWQQTYFAPTISNLTATRAIANGQAYTDDDEGNVAHIKFNWTKGTNDGADVVPDTCLIRISVQGANSWTDTTVTLTNGSEEFYITNPVLADAASYDVVVRFVITGWDNVERSTYISQAYYIMDINPDGTAVGIGGAVGDNENVLKVYMDIEAMSDIILQIDENAGSGTVDGDLYNALHALGWI